MRVLIRFFLLLGFALFAGFALMGLVVIYPFYVLADRVNARFDSNFEGW